MALISAPRAFLFDFDGTLADSYAAITASVNHVRGLYHLPEMGEAEVRRSVGHGIIELMRHVVAVADPVVAARQYEEHHPSIMAGLTRFLPTVEATLKELFRRGLKLGVCSNKPLNFTSALCDSLGITPMLGIIAGPETTGHPKPHPSMLQAAIHKLGVTVEETVYVGDMVVDIETARAAGMCVVVLPTGSNDAPTLAQARPDLLIQRMEELLSSFDLPGE